MLHGLDLTTTDPPGRLGGQAEPVGQPERGPQRGVADDPAALRVRNPPARPKRSHTKVGGAKPLASDGGRRSSLSAIPAPVRQATRLRALRRDLRANDSTSASLSRRAEGDRAARGRNESKWQTRVSPGDDRPATQCRDEGIVCPLGNKGIRRSSDLHEWRNDLATVSTRDPAKLHDE